VGGNAQIKSMKKVAGTLKIDQAQFRELEAFAKFGSDMDSVTQMVIDRGRKNNALLVQPQYTPMPVAEQIAVLYCGTHNLLRNVPIERVPEFEQLFLDVMRTIHRADVLDVLASGQLTDEAAAIIEKVAKEIVEGLA
jgi:F-type H+-transporting ATPase subunit alpha